MDNRTIAAIDVGTNSVHMVVANVSSTGFRVLAAEKEVVRLGSGVDGMDELSVDAINRGVTALKHMKRIANAHDAEIRAVATSAVREAHNGSHFIKNVEQETGIQVEVISGTEEARLIHLGVSQLMGFGNESVLTIDIGGGSTEFCVSANKRLRIAQSLKFGAVRMTDAYLPDGEVTESGLKSLRSRINSTFAPLAHDIKTLGFSRVVLSSGTNETIARIIATKRSRGIPQTFNGFSFSFKELADVVEEIVSCTSAKDRQELDGMDSKRADIIVAGAVILLEVAKALRIENFEFSEYALREGVLIDTAQRLGIMDQSKSDAAMDSVVRLAERCSVDMAHSRHVAFLSKKLLAAISRRYEVDKSVSRLLEAAAILANTGNSIAYSKHHMHSYYIIRNADLMGFSNEEIEMIALAARYHRKSGPKQSHSEFSDLSKNHQLDVELMAGILRIATGLDRSHDQCVSDLATSSKDDEFIISVRHSCESEESVLLDIYTAQERVAMLEEYLGDTIVIRNGGRT